MTRPEPVAPADLVAQARERARKLVPADLPVSWLPTPSLLTALAKALEGTAAERDDWRDTAAEAIRKRDEILRRQVALAAARDRLKDSLHEIRLGCINPQQVAHNALFREENP